MAPWQRQTSRKCHDGKELESFDPVWSMTATKHIVHQQIEKCLPDGQGPFAAAKAFLAEAIGKLDTPGAALEVRVEEDGGNDPKAQRSRAIHITIRVLPSV